MNVVRPYWFEAPGQILAGLGGHRDSGARMEGLPPWPLSDGEIHFLYWFIQGSIMIPETRHALRRAWGFCERHAWAALAVELCFRPRFLHGPALLYDDLLQRCLAVLSGNAPFRLQRVTRGLRSRGPCLMCTLDLHRAGRGGAQAGIIERGRQTVPLRQFAAELKAHWDATVCSMCSGGGTDVLCRRHLIAQRRLAAATIDTHRQMVLDIHTGIVRLARSYVWGNRNTDRPQDRAALVSAVGFLGGWHPLLLLLADARGVGSRA
jgi:hypothetical protein